MKNKHKYLIGAGLLGGGILLYYLTKKKPPVSDKAVLTGIVTGAGLPVSGVSVTFGTYSTLSDDLGGYEVTDITIGEYTITFSKEGYENKEFFMNLVKGTNTLNAALVSSKAILTGTVTKAGTSTSIQGASVVCQNKTVVTDANGSFTMTELEPGNYSIIISATGYQTAQF